MTKKVYLGDSVYVEFDGNGAMLTTENGFDPSNSIYLESETYLNLVRTVETLTQEVAGGDPTAG